MNGAEILTRFTADTSQVDKATKNYTAGLGKLTTAFTLGNIAAQAISKTIGAFNQNLDSAISRFDTMNNFPKVMSNLGIGADEANKSIDVLSEKLQGLPTSLDSAAMAVQRLTSKNGDVDKSTQLFLALNNAILAGGAGVEIQKSAIEQMSQAYAKGKPDMMEWRTMMMAMPAQLKQVATAMGYVDADALGTALREGSLSMDSFMNTIMKLNTEGIPGFSNFETQARNATGGVATSITNMKTAMARGIANMIGSIDEALKPFGGLSGVIQKIGKVGEKIFKKIGSVIASVIPKIANLVKFFQEHKVLMGALVGIITTVVAALTTYKTIMTVINTIQAVQNALLLANPAVLIIAGIVAAITGLIATITYLWNHCEGFRNVIYAIINGIKAAIEGVFNFIKGIFEGIVNTIKGVIDWVANNWQLIVGFLVNPFGAAFSLLYEKCEGFRNFINGIVEKVKGAFSKAGDAIKTTFTAVKDFVKNVFSTIGNIVKAPINAIIGGINKVLQAINSIQIPDWVPGIGGAHTNFGMIPQLNVGTNYVPEDTLAMIHKGEAVIPKKFNPYANGVNSQTIGTMNASTPTINVQVYNDIKQDPLGQMVSNIKTFSGGSKNDYNYGMGN